MTDAGRSTTSPAAIWFASRGLSSSMRALPPIASSLIA
jgi:hypothetical protein